MWRLIITQLRVAPHHKVVPICTVSQQVLCVLPHCHFRLWHGDILLSVGQALHFLYHLDQVPSRTGCGMLHATGRLSFNAATRLWLQVRPSKVEWQNRVFLNPLLRFGLSTKSDYRHLSHHDNIMGTVHNITKLWTLFTSLNYGQLAQNHKIMDTFHSFTKLWTPFAASHNFGHLSQHHKIMGTFHSIITNNIQACPIPAAGESKLIHFV
jgi:hypothetical protein